MTDDLQVPAGTVLCKEDTLGREFFVLVEGTVDVTRGGKQIATRGAGDFVGEIALLTEARRTATVRAATPVRCLILMRGDFRRVLDENRSIERKVMQALARAPGRVRRRLGRLTPPPRRSVANPARGAVVRAGDGSPRVRRARPGDAGFPQWPGAPLR